MYFCLTHFIADATKVQGKAAVLISKERSLSVLEAAAMQSHQHTSQKGKNLSAELLVCFLLPFEECGILL